jgi:heptosyltransferase-2
LANSWKSALIPWLARIPHRTGWLGEMRWGLLNDVRFLNKKALPRMVQRYAALGLVPNASMPELPTPQLNAPAETVATVLEKFTIDQSKPILALCPGAAYGPAKRWPEDYYAKIAQQRIAAGWQVWFFGSQADNTVIENIRSQINTETISFAGKIDLMETIDLLSIVQAVVTNDSGLLHIAASLNKPLVAIYGSTSAEFTPPLGKKSKIMQEQLSCRPCFKRECPLRHLNCMYLIKPERVLAAIEELE